MTKRSFLVSLLFVVLFSTASFASTRTFTYMTVHVPSGWTATESNSGKTLMLEDEAESNYLVIFELIEKGSNSLYGVAREYYSKDSGTEFQEDSGGYYSYKTSHWGPASLVMIHDSSTLSDVPSGYCLYKLVSDAVPEGIWNNINTSLRFHMGGGGGGGGGGCNPGFGILSLLALGFVFRKK